MTTREFLRRARRFGRDVAGAGAIEFALIAPVLLLLLVGGSELGIALTIDRKVKAAAGAAADLASQSTSLADADLRKLMGIAKGTLAPYSSAPLDMRLTQIAITGEGKAEVDWSCPTSGYDKQPKGTPVTVPPEFNDVAKQLISEITKKSGHPSHPIYTTETTVTWETIYIIRGESKYRYRPVTGRVLSDTITLEGLTFVQPRYSDKVQSDTEGCSAFSLG